MCSIVIFAKPDNDHPDPDLDHHKFKRGDVIDISDDDAMFWGHDVHGKTALGWWRVVVLPGVAAKDLQSLVMGDAAQLGDKDPPRLRSNRIDLDALEALHPVEGVESIITDRDTLLKLRSTVVRKSAALA